MKKDYSILIGGAAGQGSRMAGLIIAKIFNSMGYSVFIHEDYQSLVKGGHNFSLIRASEKEYTSHNNEVDFVLALNNETIFKHEKCLKKDGFIIFNKKNIEVKKGIGIEIDKIVKELDGISIMGNIAMISGFAKIVGIEWKTIEKIFKKEISKKIDKNLEIAKRAYNEVDKIIEIEKLKRKEGTLLTGNEAICLGAVDAGLDVYSAYPMTPATSILHYLAENSKKFKVIVSQSENEIAAINSIIGSAYAGKGQ